MWSTPVEGSKKKGMPSPEKEASPSEKTAKPGGMPGIFRANSRGSCEDPVVACLIQ